jgi:hypothetical protein
VGDLLWLPHHHRALASLQLQAIGKLKLRFYGPYRVAAVINDFAY